MEKENLQVGKIVTEKFINGQDHLVVITTPIGNQGLFARVLVDPGKPYWWWPTLPPKQVIGCDFTGAPIISDDVAENNTNIASITATPEEKLTYAD